MSGTVTRIYRWYTVLYATATYSWGPWIKHDLITALLYPVLKYQRLWSVDQQCEVRSIHVFGYIASRRPKSRPNNSFLVCLASLGNLHFSFKCGKPDIVLANILSTCESDHMHTVCTWTTTSYRLLWPLPIVHGKAEFHFVGTPHFPEKIAQYFTCISGIISAFHSKIQTWSFVRHTFSRGNL